MRNVFDTELLTDVNTARLHLVCAKEKLAEVCKGLEVYHDQTQKREAWLDVQIAQQEYILKIQMYQKDLHEQAYNLLPGFLYEKFSEIVPLEPTGQCINVDPNGFTYFQ